MNSKVATILPLAHLDLVRDDDYHMALSYECSESDYVAFFRKRSREGKHVVLDNSTIELGEPESLDTYIGKAIDMEATEIILPDWFQDSKRTLESVAEGLNAVAKLGYAGRIMVAPQGRSVMEWVECASSALLYPIDTIGISRRYNAMFGGSRGAHAAIVRSLRANAMIHFLGCWGDPTTELGISIDVDYVQGIDSSLPALYAKHGRPLSFDGSRPDGIIDLLHDSYDVEGYLGGNIEAWRERCRPRPSQDSLETPTTHSTAST